MELQFLQGLQELTSAQAVAAPTAAAPTDVARTQYVTTPQAKAAPTGPLLPDSRPRPDVLTNKVDEAYRQIGRVPSSNERKEMIALANDLAGKGKSATEIKYAVIEKLKAIQSGSTVKPSTAELRSMASETFKSLFGRAPGEGELSRWTAEAQKLADQGMDATSIKYNLPSMMREVRDGLDKTDPAALRGLAKETFKSVFGREPSAGELSRWEGEAKKLVDENKLNATGVKSTLPSMMREVRDGLDKTDAATLRTLAKDAFKTTFGREPSAGELSRWEGEAKKLVDENKLNATGVKSTLPSMMREVRDGLDKTDAATLRTLAKDAFKTTFGREPSAGELSRWEGEAKKLVDENKLNATGVKNTLPGMMREVRDGLDKTDAATLRTLAKDAFKATYGREPSAGELSRWEGEAKKLVDENKLNASGVKNTLPSMMREARDGLDKTDRATLMRVLDEALHEVLGSSYRPPSSSEVSAWMKMADDMVKDKASATAIKYAFLTSLRVALDNQGW
ncbi:hypothetical protein [Corallococcus sp. Z5C101001]|uniref:hypothetical protein n=1 Tax=Corallococcus sp. Z5C101001 TaxID=2596829 RepID=UPI00117DA77E|nr:hypothetical protein [Corallococcus sp. Z5C101001]